MWLLIRPSLKYIIAAAAIIGAVWWFSHSRFQAGYRAAQAEMAEQVRKAEEAARAAEAKSASITEAKDREFQTERENLRGRVNDLLSRPAPAIRLCKPATSRSAVPAVPDPAGQPDAAPVESGPALQAGRDIRGQLVLYGGDSERCRVQLSALQSWIVAQASR